MARPVFRIVICTRAVSPALTAGASQRLVKDSLGERRVTGGLGLGVGVGGGGEPIATVTDEELFAELGSAVVAETVPTLVTEPPAPPTTLT